jgi:hypothetical protein
VGGRQAVLHGGDHVPPRGQVAVQLGSWLRPPAAPRAAVDHQHGGRTPAGPRRLVQVQAQRPRGTVRIDEGPHAHGGERTPRSRSAATRGAVRAGAPGADRGPRRAEGGFEVTRERAGDRDGADGRGERQARGQHPQRGGGPARRRPPPPGEEREQRRGGEDVPPFGHADGRLPEQVVGGGQNGEHGEQQNRGPRRPGAARPGRRAAVSEGDRPRAAAPCRPERRRGPRGRLRRRGARAWESRVPR